MGAVADICKFLGGNKDDFPVIVAGLFHHQNPVIFRVVNDIDLPVACKGVAFGNISGHHMPFIQRVREPVVVDHLIVVAVHNKEHVVHLGDISRYI